MHQYVPFINKREREKWFVFHVVILHFMCTSFMNKRWKNEEFEYLENEMQRQRQGKKRDSVRDNERVVEG